MNTFKLTVEENKEAKKVLDNKVDNLTIRQALELLVPR